MATMIENPQRSQPRSVARTVAGNSAANLTRLGITSLISVALPAYLTHHLPLKTYGAWVLILQLSAYVAYLDFGVQTAVSKYIAEHEAKNNSAASGRCASAGVAIMLVAMILGLVLTFVLAWRVPFIFHTMPADLYRDVRLSVLFVGTSLSITLATSAFQAIFLGLQNYRVPMVLTIANRVLFGAAVCLAVAFHTSLAVMGAAAAASNLLLALLRVVAWRRLASHIRISVRSIDLNLLRQMLQYCAVLTVWSVCALFISGLDLTIVGHYSFAETGFYAIANSPTSFLLMISSAVMAPLLPATSALSVQRSASQMGGVLLRSTRYAVIVLLLTGLPFLVAGYWILRKWVGPIYAEHSLHFLQILVLANIVRTVCAPYATMVVAMSRQSVATASPVAEGLVNLVSSIWLARHFGAMGVALGTLIGAVVGVAMHFGISMRFTQSALALPRMDLFLRGMLRPAALALPSVLLLLWRGAGTVTLASVPGFDAAIITLWAVSTLVMAWAVSMTHGDREMVVGALRSRIQSNWPGPGRSVEST
jgi:O-antigen/teichoic acid export membrane protein